MTRPAWSRLGPAGKAAVVACGTAVLVAAATLPSLAAALFTRSPEPPESPAAPGDGASERIKAQLAQVDGRSLFFVPSAPPAAPPPPTPKDAGPRTPPKPRVYGGPKLVAMINDTAWFGDDKAVTVLSVGGDAAGGVELISVNPPWGATVLWQGVEFQVPLFEPDTIVNKAPLAAPSPESAAAGVEPASLFEGPPPPDDAEGASLQE